MTFTLLYFVTGTLASLCYSIGRDQHGAMTTRDWAYGFVGTTFIWAPCYGAAKYLETLL